MMIQGENIIHASASYVFFLMETDVRLAAVQQIHFEMA